MEHINTPARTSHRNDTRNPDHRTQDMAGRIDTRNSTLLPAIRYRRYRLCQQSKFVIEKRELCRSRRSQQKCGEMDQNRLYCRISGNLIVHRVSRRLHIYGIFILIHEQEIEIYCRDNGCPYDMFYFLFSRPSRMSVIPQVPVSRTYRSGMSGLWNPTRFAQLAASAHHRCPTVQCVTDFFTPLYRPTSLCRNVPYSIPQTLHRHTPADIYPVLPHCRNSLVDREESHHQFLN